MKAKKSLLVVICCVITFTLTAVDQTFTISSSTLQGIRNVCLADPSETEDPLIWLYYQETRETRELTPEEIEELGDRYYADPFDLLYNCRKAYNGLIHNNVDFMNEVIFFLLVESEDSFDWEGFELAIYNPDGPQADDFYARALDMSYGLNFIAFMCDMAYYYMSPGQQALLQAKLDDLIDWAIDDIYNSDLWTTNPGYCYDYYSRLPEIGASSFRLINLSGLGYCCLVAGEDLTPGTRLKDFVMEQFFSTDFYPEGTDLHGYQDYGVTNSGMYIGGYTYANRAIYLTPLFFTALKRVTEFNMWDTDFMNGWMTQIMMRNDPQFCHITQEDDFRHRSAGADEYPPNDNNNIEKGLLPYYYNNTNNLELRKSIRWYVHRAKENNNGDYPLETNEANTESFDVVMCYDPESVSSMPITTDNYFPSYLETGSYSDGELTILRPQATANNIITINDDKVLDVPWMSINHENSFDHNHWNSDKTHFQLFYKGEYLIIDLGYKTWYNTLEHNGISYSQWGRTMEWFESPYAHNLIIINPDSTDIEGSTYVGEFSDLTEWCYYSAEEIFAHPIQDLNKKDPISHLNRFEYHTVNDIPNPAQKEFLITNDEIQHLKVSVNYDNKKPDMYGTEHPCIVSRGFYMIDDHYYIIYDRVDNTEGEENNYRNQIHFNPVSEETFDNDHESHFCSSVNNIFLHGVMGAVNNFHTNYEDKDINYGAYYNGLPTGWDGDDTSHSRLRITTKNMINEQFITLLIPSEDIADPIELIADHSYGYGVRYDLDTSDDYDTYAAVYSGDSQFEFTQISLQFVTSADFFLVEANSSFTDIRKLIINGDNYIRARDQLSRFTAVELYDSDYEAEEVMAEWDNGELYVTHKTEENDRTQYRILRCGVEPENLHSKTEFGTYQPGTEPGGERGTIEDNISYLAYDDEYFYVNYDYSDLVAGNMLTEDLTIHSGVFNGIIIQDIVQFGCGEIILKDEIYVPTGAEIIFLASAHPELAEDFHLIVDGVLTAIGNEENVIVFDKYLTNNWNKIEITEIGSAELEYCEFQNAEFPLNSKGEIIVDNCEFLYNDRGIYLEKPERYQINNSYIHNCGLFGILLMNSHEPIYRSEIKYSKFTGNDYGLWFYNASAVVLNDTIYANKYAGILANRGSNPVVTKSTISYTHYDGTDYPEIKISGTSYPVVDKRCNDIIFGNSYSFYNQDAVTLEYYCRDLWWGTTIENDVEDSFFPANWQVNYLPVHTSPWVGYDPLAGDGLFSLGLIAESEGDYETAKDYYMQSIAENPDDIEAIWSANRLINCLDTESEYIELQDYFSELSAQYPETKLSETINLENTFCNRLMGDYQSAITEYEVLLDDELTFIDSIYTELDIVYTYLEASSGGTRAAINFTNLERQLNSIEQAKEKEQSLWSLLNNQSKDGGIYSPEVTGIELFQNFPNPFNPTTTISFSLPENSVIEFSIYNIKGQKVKKLLSGDFDKGIHSVIWNGEEENGKLAGSGVYFYRLNVDGKTEAVKRCLLLK
ncbi:MAG: right-handed parallel beta-helix repeat-containing protein [Candidatus Stygibacter australis]|nr:right-handed parallel beta-helix repeat-containing protein [Candidatus Stygibacter australis]MDP8322763.1 right-handed parallel beta-helix repeat-containing protein [Candidatus Stygibacter australis]